MKGKILLVVGLGVGYVLGARAGRERYEQIKRMTDKFWNSKGVQKQVHHAEDFAKAKASEGVDLLADGAKKVVSQVTGSTKTTPAKKPVARTSPTTRATPTKD